MSYSQCLSILLLSFVISVAVTDYPHCGDDCSTDPCQCCKSFNTSGLIQLFMDINCQEPNRSKIIEPDNKSNDDSYSIDKTYSCLTKLPENFCDFPKIKSIKIRMNKISEVPNLSCLSELVHLDLSFNKITTLKTGIFDSLTKLQVIRLQYNEIKTIEAGVFHTNLSSIRRVYLKHNNLTKIDVWSVLNITHIFCIFDVSYNQINQLINENGRKIKGMEDVHGPGFVSLQHNKLQTWFSEVLKSLGFPSEIILGYFLPWGFNLHHNPWICDCKMYDLIIIVKNFLKFAYFKLYRIYCSKPQVKLFEDLELEELVCNITDGCPSGCLCQDQPAFSRFFIDCKNSGLGELPVHLPNRKNLHLNMNNNSINRLDNRKYLNSVVHLDLSDNNITFISPQSIDNLNSLKYLNLNNNGIEFLPENIQKLRLSELDISNNDLICNCSNTWMSKWVNMTKHFLINGSHLTCTVENNRDFIIQDMNTDILNCRPMIISKIIIIPITVSLVIVIIIIVICIYFRYELLTIYYLKLKFRRHVLDEFTYDVYISCDEENDEDRIWIQENILQLFDNLGLKCYTSFRDGMGGEITVDKNIKTINNSRIVLILASDTYITNSKNMIELNEIYHETISNKNRKLILIKRGEFQSSKINNGYIRSLFRLKLYLSSNDENLTNKMIKRINLYLSGSRNIKTELEIFDYTEFH